MSSWQCKGRQPVARSAGVFQLCGLVFLFPCDIVAIFVSQIATEVGIGEEIRVDNSCIVVPNDCFTAQRPIAVHDVLLAGADLEWESP